MAEKTGAAVWVRCQRRAWTRGVVESKEQQADGKWAFRVRKVPEDDDSNDDHDGYDEEDEFMTILGDSHDISGNADLYLCNEFEDDRELADVDDLTWLTHLHEPSILQALQDRFAKDIIYTNTGPILLAVNPFKKINMYSDDRLGLYFSSGLLKSQGLEAPTLPPHVYATGDAAYRAMFDNTADTGKNQSILVSGESGAGKTESTKFIMRYLATVSCEENDKDGQKIADMVLQSNPILEAFGNARTTRNDNSSRFGKFIEMQFNKKGTLVGARIVTYLLEKVRLAKQGLGERNFHVFYQLARGAPEDKLAKWMVPELEECNITNQSECFDRQDHVDDDDEYEKMWKAMEIMGFSGEEMESLMCTVSAVMNLGSLRFCEDASGEGSELDPDSSDAAAKCGKLLQVDPSALATALTTRQIKVVGSDPVVKQLNKSEAIDACEALVKTIYSRMFDHIVLRVNESIQANKRTKTDFIGVLDIFGFECFVSNSFEQLCINYANETLQQQFNQFVFKLEQKEYEKEKIKWSFIDFPDNQKCLDLIESKPIGILSLLDEQCLFPKGNDQSLAGKFYEKLTNIERFSVSNKERVAFHFTVEHYAGNVSYDTFGFVAKNKDQLYQEALDLMQTGSSSPLIRTLFPQPKASPTSGGSRVQSKTVGSQFKEQLSALLKTIRTTAPHYVRCLKPNDVAAANKIVRPRLVDQLRYGGVLEAVKVARAGYPVRLLIGDFVARYFYLGKKLVNTRLARQDSDGRPAATKLLEVAGLEGDSEYQMGKTKLFLRKGAYEKLEELRLGRLKDMATRIQSMARARKEWRAFRAMRQAIGKMQAVARGMIGRNKATLARKVRAAILVQCWSRALMARKERARLKLLRDTALKREAAILRVQGFIKAVPHRVRFKKFRRGLIALQSAFRLKCAKRQLKDLRMEAKSVGNLQEKLAAAELALKAAAQAPPAAEPAVVVQQVVKEDEAKVSDLTAQLDKAHSLIAQLEKDLEDERSAHNDTKTLLLAATAAGTGAAAASAAATNEIDSSLHSGPVVSQDEFEALEDQIMGYQSEIEVHKEQALNNQSEIDELKKQLELAVGPGGAAAVAARYLAGGNDLPDDGELKKRAEELESENTQLLTQLEMHVERMCDAQNQAMEAQNEVVRLRKDNVDLSNKVDAFNKVNEQASGVKIALAKRLEVLIFECASLREEATEAKENLEAARQEASILKKALKQGAPQ